MTRQYRWQQKMRAIGRCILCGRRAVTQQHCQAHRLQHNRLQLAHYYQHHTARLAYMKQYRKTHRKELNAYWRTYYRRKLSPRRVG